MDTLNWLLGVNIATFIAILGFGYRMIRFFVRIEFKTDMMWKDYEYRMGVDSGRET